MTQQIHCPKWVYANVANSKPCIRITFLFTTGNLLHRSLAVRHCTRELLSQDMQVSHEAACLKEETESRGKQQEMES